VLRHRLVLSYEALSEGIDSDAILDRVLDAVPESAAAPLPAQGHYAA
jgi:MoxR-like ATPase